MPDATFTRFEVPLRPRIRKFLHVKLAGLPLTAGFDYPPFGSWLYTVSQIPMMELLTRRSTVNNKNNRAYFSPEFSERLTVDIDHFHHTRRTHLLNQLEAEMFDRLVEFHAKSEYIALIVANDRQTVSDSELRRQWVDQYDFSDEDFTEDSLHHLVKRFRRGEMGNTFLLKPPTP